MTGHTDGVLAQTQVFVLLVVVVEGVHGLLVLPVHPAVFTAAHRGAE